jgi:MFS family permease
MNAIGATLRDLRSFNRPARLFLLATITDGIVYSGWSLFFNFFILERGFDKGFLGLLNAMPSISALLLAIPMGRLSDRMGRKRAMLVGVTLSVLCWIVELVVRQPALILAAAFFNGAFGMLYFLSQAPFMMKVSTQENRTLLFSLSYGFVTLSSAVGSLFAGQLPRMFAGLLGVAERSAQAYQAVLLMSAFLSIFTLIPLLLIQEPKAEAPVQQPVKSSTEPAKKVKYSTLKVVLKPITLRLSLPNLLIGSGAALLIPYLNLFFVERFQVSDQNLGLLFSLSSLMTGVGVIVAPVLSTRMGGKINAVIWTQAASLLFMVIMGFTPFLPLVAFAYLMRGTLMNMAVPLYSAYAMEKVPESEGGTVNSVKELAWQVGWSVGPYVSGLVQERYGFTPLFIATSILYVLAIVVTWYFFGVKKPTLEPACPETMPDCLSESLGD